MHGQLFTSDFLRDGIRETPGWAAAEKDFAAFREAVRRIFSAVAADTNFNEAQTEDEVILPLLKALGWNESLRQQTANRSGREDVPDFLLFASTEAKRAAAAEKRGDQRRRSGSLSSRVLHPVPARGISAASARPRRSRAISASTAHRSPGMPKTAATASPASTRCTSACTACRATKPPTCSTPS